MHDKGMIGIQGRQDEKYTEYMTSYRLQMACQMLARGQESITVISHACGLGSSSYFGKVLKWS